MYHSKRRGFAGPDGRHGVVRVSVNPEDERGSGAEGRVYFGSFHPSHPRSGRTLARVDCALKVYALIHDQGGAWFPVPERSGCEIWPVLPLSGEI